MDPNSPFAILLQPLVMAKLTMVPIVLQYVKPFIAKFAGSAAGPVAGVVASVLGVGLAIWGGVEAKLDAWAIASQAAIAFAYVQGFYLAVVAPAARSSNPIVPANPAVLPLIVGAMLFLVPAASAQTYSIWDAGKRTQLSVNAGGMVFFEEETGTESWRGVSAGGALTYSLHDRFSVFGTYDHGFPIDASTGHENLLRGSANLKVYPPRGEASNTKLFIGAGAAFFQRGDTDGWRGYEGHLTIARVFKDGWSLAATYVHGRPFDDLDERVNMAKVVLGHRLLGAK